MKDGGSREKSGGAYFVPLSCNPKLAPIEYVDAGGRRLRPVPRPPHVAVTYASIEATCDDGCAFKGRGCYVTSGFANRWMTGLDEAAKGHTADEVIAAECDLIDHAFRGRTPYVGRLPRRPGGRVPQDGGRDGRQGRDLRLHVAGDVATEANARRLAASAERWRERGGGVVWTYTHDWRRIAADAFGPVSVLASVETPGAASEARRKGYAVAIVVREFPSARAFRLAGMADRVVPCPAETRGTTCVQCRLCLDAPMLRANGIAIGFALHGRDAAKVRRRLPVVREVVAHA